MRNTTSIEIFNNTWPKLGLDHRYCCLVTVFKDLYGGREIIAVICKAKELK